MASSGIQSATSSEGLPGAFKAWGLSPREAGWGGFREARVGVGVEDKSRTVVNIHV